MQAAKLAHGRRALPIERPVSDIPLDFQIFQLVIDFRQTETEEQEDGQEESGDHELRLMSLEKSTFDWLCSVKLTSEKILCIEFSSAGHEVAVGISNGQSIIYDAFSLKEHTRLQGSDHAVVATTFNDDGNYFAAADASHAVNLWERDDTSK